ncbi:hypothetical protein SAMN05421863_108816 [Nitrosomonas communis]|uniref:Uncharacterized protein n=1 Tax=Nitrosomonas communis TaxID=44574 RepID=A0A1I4VQV9_9PROT|nr:hypothetical protein SAMN05421863_108816 [Nitrosomonas communis]
MKTFYFLQTLENVMKILRNHIKPIGILFGTLFICAASVGVTFAQSGHFVGT